MNTKKKILFVFFLSGATGLIYQVLWGRMMGAIFGNTTYAVSTVLAGFMAGLALGSFYFGRYIDRNKTDLLKIYSKLSAGIGLYAALSPLVFAAIHKIYSLIGAEQITFPTTLAVFILGFTAVLIPTSLMGGTLPVLTKYFNRKSSKEDKFGFNVGMLYSVNTWGAVMGAFLTGYVLIMILGVRGTLYLASAVNVAIAGIVFMLSKNAAADFSVRNNDERNLKAAAAADNSRLPERSGGRGLPILIAIAVSGFTALTYEVVWTRVLSMVLGSSVYAFVTMLCAFLAGIALGSFIYTRISKSNEVFSGVSFFGVTQAGIGISVLLLVPVFTLLPGVYLKLFMEFGSSFAGFQVMQFFMAFGVMIIPTTLFGMTLPAACGIYAASGTQGPGNSDSTIQSFAGSAVGNVYAANTTGAIAGSLLSGFALIPLIGLQKSITATAVVNVILAVILLNSGLKEKKWARGLMVSFILFFTVPYIFAVPEWNREILTSGIYNYAEVYARIYEDRMSGLTGKRKAGFLKLTEENCEILYHKESTHFTVTVLKDKRNENISLKIDGKTDASSNIRGDMTTQILSAHLPLALHHDPENVLVVGLASGVTLGSVTKWENLKEIDCVEIEPAIIEASRYFDKYNGKPLEDPRVEVIINDARNYLITADKKYDIIISEPSNPWMSGCAPLFTQDYFKQIKSKLNSGGLFCMWLQGYSLSLEDYGMIIRTLNTVFGNISIWEGSPADTLVIAGDKKLSINFVRLKNRISRPAVREDLARVGMENAFDFLAGFIAGEEGVGRIVKGGSRINSDNHPHLEFTAGKTINSRDLLAKIGRMLSANMESVSDYLKDFKNHYELAGAYLKKKNYPMVETELKKSIKKSVRKKESCNLLGYTYLLQNKLDAAEQMLERAISIEPAFIEPYVNLSRVAASRGDLGKAEKILKSVVRARPDYYAAYNILGTIYLKQGKYDRALKEFEKAADAGPGWESPYVSMAGVYLDIKGSPGKAKKYLLKAVESNPSSASAYFQLGRAWIKLGEPEKAAEAFDTAMKLRPAYVDLVRKELPALNRVKKEAGQ